MSNFSNLYNYLPAKTIKSFNKNKNIFKIINYSNFEVFMRDICFKKAIGLIENLNIKNLKLNKAGNLRLHISHDPTLIFSLPKNLTGHQEWAIADRDLFNLYSVLGDLNFFTFFEPRIRELEFSENMILSSKKVQEMPFEFFGINSLRAENFCITSCFRSSSNISDCEYLWGLFKDRLPTLHARFIYADIKSYDLDYFLNSCKNYKKYQHILDLREYDRWDVIRASEQLFKANLDFICLVRPNTRYNLADSSLKIEPSILENLCEIT
jgi:hypothetical protein